MTYYERRKLYRRSRWQKLRLEVFRRDGYRCVQCGKPGRLECDHKVPYNEFTTVEEFHNIDALQTLCRGCHINKTALEAKARQGNPESKEERDLAKFVKELL